MRILFQNENFVAIDKPAGFLSVPGRDPKDLRPVLGLLLQERLGRSVFPIHRLDAEVSGLVLYALNPSAHREANLAFENREVQKEYQAVSSGGFWDDGATGTWKAKILRGKKRAYESPVGKLAITEYFVKQNHRRDLIEWRLRPHTGRSHQLRWELFRHESPIVGDLLYGSRMGWRGEGIALRSIGLEFRSQRLKEFQMPEKLFAEPLPLDLFSN